jgi:hypothetical protein
MVVIISCVALADLLGRMEINEKYLPRTCQNRNSNKRDDIVTEPFFGWKKRGGGWAFRTKAADGRWSTVPARWRCKRGEFPSAWRALLPLARKELVQDAAYIRDVIGRCFPHQSNIHMTIVMSHDVAHSAHLPEWKAGQCGSRLFAEMRSRLADDLDPPNYGILLFGIFEKVIRWDVLEV